MKKLLILGGIAAAIFAPAPANATTYQIGTPDCFVQIDTIEPNIVMGGFPHYSIDPEGDPGAGLHCPPSDESGNSVQIGYPDCFVQIDYIEPNIVMGGFPHYTMDPPGHTGASLHCLP